METGCGFSALLVLARSCSPAENFIPLPFVQGQPPPSKAGEWQKVFNLRAVSEQGKASALLSSSHPCLAKTRQRASLPSYLGRGCKRVTCVCFLRRRILPATRPTHPYGLLPSGRLVPTSRGPNSNRIGALRGGDDCDGVAGGAFPGGPRSDRVSSLPAGHHHQDHPRDRAYELPAGFLLLLHWVREGQPVTVPGCCAAASRKPRGRNGSWMPPRATVAVVVSGILAACPLPGSVGEMLDLGDGATGQCLLVCFPTAGGGCVCYLASSSQTCGTIHQPLRWECPESQGMWMALTAACSLSFQV